MTTPELDEQLQEHYGSFHRGHALLRERLMEQLQAAPDAPARRADTTSRFFNRRLLMRLSAAAIVALAIGITVFLVTPGTQGTTWAEVVKAMGPVESVQYRTSQKRDDVAGEVDINMHYVTPSAMRVDMWPNHPDERGPGKTPPAMTNIAVGNEREITDYAVSLSDGRPTSIVQQVAYLSRTCPLPGRLGPNLEQSRQVLEMWRGLQGLPPEAVLKRGSTEDGAKRLLRFEVIPAASAPGLAGMSGFSNTFILVDPQTKQPVVLEMGSTRWTDLHFNEAIPAERFAPPAVPEDLDAEVSWHFTLLADTWKKAGFVFRVLDPEGKPIVTKDDVEIIDAPPRFGGQGFGTPDLEDGMPAGAPPARSVASAQGFLSQEGVNKLDRFMARNPGAEMTIEITGEPPIKRKVYGRLSRRPESGSPGGGAVGFHLPSLADAKAATQPAQPSPGFEGPDMMGEGPAAPNGRPGIHPGAPRFRGGR
jgi:hypothetical protein